MINYNVAQICLNGHIITTDLHTLPNKGNKFCDQCGAKVISNCLNCNAEIRGKVVSSRSYRGGYSYKAPAYCTNCGQPYPWTQKQVDALHDLALEAEELSDEEKDKLIESIPDLLTDTPQTNLAAERWKRALTQVGRSTADAARQILIDVLSEAVKKIIFPRT